MDVSDRRLAKIIRKLQDLPGQDIFQYVNGDGKVRDVTSQDVNDYLREITGEEFTAKDFRTWAGTVLPAMALNAQGRSRTRLRRKRTSKMRSPPSQKSWAIRPPFAGNAMSTRGAGNLSGWRHDRRPEAEN